MFCATTRHAPHDRQRLLGRNRATWSAGTHPGETKRSEEHTSELQSPCNLVCRLLLEKKKIWRTREALSSVLMVASAVLTFILFRWLITDQQETKGTTLPVDEEYVEQTEEHLDGQAKP